jgi:hypothetical protein
MVNECGLIEKRKKLEAFDEKCRIPPKKELPRRGGMGKHYFVFFVTDSVTAHVHDRFAKQGGRGSPPAVPFPAAIEHLKFCGVLRTWRFTFKLSWKHLPSRDDVYHSNMCLILLCFFSPIHMKERWLHCEAKGVRSAMLRMSSRGDVCHRNICLISLRFFTAIHIRESWFHFDAKGARTHLRVECDPTSRRNYSIHSFVRQEKMEEWT